MLIFACLQGVHAQNEISPEVRGDRQEAERHDLKLKMSRRRKSRTPVASRPAPNDGTPLGHLSDVELVKQFAREVARRRAVGGKLDLGAIESFAGDVQRDLGEETLSAVIEALPAEDSTPKPCPKCGYPTPVKVHNRVRNILTVAGELRLSRNYHHCGCGTGFYPRDLELKLPEQGEISDAMERRVLDFGINDTFDGVAERWSIHYPTSISSNLVRRVMDRVGLRCEAASSEEMLQRASREPPEELAKMLIVATDGSMLLTREDAWKEAKVGVIARAEAFQDEKQRRRVDEARYVAVLGGQQEFKKSLAAALAVERADEVPTVAWLGDGARGNWTTATELCPLAIQILDIPHAVHWGMECGKALLGEGHAALPLWEARINHLIDADSPDAAISELLECLPLTTTDDHLAALDDVIGYYRTNEKRMRYRTFRQLGLPVGSGIVESAHRHVLQVRMKRAGQRWSIVRARRMARLRAVYRTAGAHQFHRAIRDGLKVSAPHAHQTMPNAPRRIKRDFKPSRMSPAGRTAASK